MARNRANRGESRAKRLARLKSNPTEAIETLLNSIANFFNNEIALAPSQYQTSLLFLGIHAAALTIGEAFFNSQGQSRELDNYRAFLQAFVDGPTSDTQFSTVADDIHNWRNILAHQWLGSLGHSIEYDYSMPLGWKRKQDTLVINPQRYCDAYLDAFKVGGRIWKYDTLFTPTELSQIHTRIVDKYARR